MNLLCELIICKIVVCFIEIDWNYRIRMKSSVVLFESIDTVRVNRFATQFALNCMFGMRRTEMADSFWSIIEVFLAAWMWAIAHRRKIPIGHFPKSSQSDRVIYRSVIIDFGFHLFE